MSTKGDAGAEGRVVTKVVITYHTADDSTERTLTMEHGGKGEPVNAIVWSDDLMRKLAYLEGETCVEPKKAPGTGDWRVDGATPPSDARTMEQSALTAEASGVRTDCIWIHDPDCMWWEYCAE
jgi:hypothetical protein